MNDIICSRAPVRICDIGGWTDTWFYPNGAVFNFCVDLYSHIRVVQRKNSEINIISENLDMSTKIDDYTKIKYDGNLDLLKAAVKRMDIELGLDIYVKADVPPGCGTGTSASVAVSLIAALARLTSKDMTPTEIAKLAHKLEIEELDLESGVQDQYAAALGGINFMEIDYPSVKVSHIQVDEKKISELESQMILVYLSSRSSSEMHKAVIKNYQKGDKNTLESFEIIKNCAYDMKKAISAVDLKYLGEVMNKNWEAQKKLHELMVNPIIEKTERLAKRNGAIGFKLNGAGGGGSAIILANWGVENKLKRKLIENGLEILPFKLDFTGVQSWTA